MRAKKQQNIPKPHHNEAQDLFPPARLYAQRELAHCHGVGLVQVREEVHGPVPQLQEVLIVRKKQRLSGAAARKARQDLCAVLGQVFLAPEKVRDLRLLHRPGLQNNAPAQYRRQKSAEPVRDQNNNGVLRRLFERFEQGVLRLNGQFLRVRDDIDLARVGIRLDRQVGAHVADFFDADAVRFFVSDRDNVRLVAALDLYTGQALAARLQQAGARPHGGLA